MQWRVDDTWELHRIGGGRYALRSADTEVAVRYERSGHRVTVEDRALAHLQTRVEHFVHANESIRRCRGCRRFYGPSESRGFGVNVPGYCGQCVKQTVIARHAR
jgi:hypothetical protein